MAVQLSASNIDKNVANSDKKEYYKISYHITYWKKKVNSAKLKKNIEQHMDIFRDAELEKIIGF